MAFDNYNEDSFLFILFMDSSQIYWFPSGFGLLSDVVREQCQARSPGFVCWSVWYRMGHWNIAPNPEGEAGSWGACKSLIFFLWEEVCTQCGSCTRGERHGICCCFYGIADSLFELPPHGICLAGCVSAHGCVCEHYERGEGLEVPLCPAPWLCFTIFSSRGWFPWKRIWISSQFKGLRERGREREQGCGWMGWEPKAFPGITRGSDATSREAFCQC